MRHLFTAFVLALCVSAVAIPLAAQPTAPQVPSRPIPRPGMPAAQTAARPTPKLVVLLVVDQMRADYVEKFGHNWTGGLRRLLNEGAWFRDAAYRHTATVTCVGHTTIVTGSLPRTHGIIGNDLWNREAGRGGNCVADPETTLVSYGQPAKGTATSTRNIVVPTLADEMRAQLPGPTRIVSLSLKDYTATSMAGRRADAVVWMSVSNMAFMSSSAYGPAPVPWLAEFIKANPVEADLGKSWTKLLPETAYVHADDAEGELTPFGWTRVFPHVLKGEAAKGEAGKGEAAAADKVFYNAWDTSPFSDAYLIRMAGASIDALKLGQGGGTDFLAVSFSALDLVGHAYGPRSHEVQDVLARLDVNLAPLFAKLDKTVGRDNYLLAVTGDHGVSPIPEQMAALGLGGGRVLTGDLLGRIEKALEPYLGPGKKVARLSYNELYFERGVYDKMRANPEAMRAALEAARATPGVARVFSSEELADAHGTSNDEIEAAALANFFPSRSGDFSVILRPYYQFTSSGTTKGGSTHGSAYWYDRRVPIFLMGQGIKRGQYLGDAAPVDIAPTLAFLMGITLPAADGRVLNEALLPTDAVGRR